MARSGGRCLLARRRGEEERGGGRPRSVLRTPRRIGRRAGEARGGRRRLEGGGYSAGAHCSALQSAQMAGMAFSMPCGRGQPCPVAQGWSKEVGRGIGCSGWPVGEERGRRRGRNGLSRERKRWFHPSNNGAVDFPLLLEVKGD